MRKLEFLNLFFTIPKPKSGGLRMVKSRITYGQVKPFKNVVFEDEEGFAFYIPKGQAQLRIRIPTKLHNGRRLKRFVRDYVKNQGGRPSTANFWISTF